MKQLSFLCFLAITYCSSAQIFTPDNSLSLSNEKVTSYSVVKVFLENHEQMHELSDLQIDMDHHHGDHKSGVVLTLDELDMEILRKSGFTYETIIEDHDKFYKSRQLKDQSKIANVQRSMRTANNFGYGSMGGFYTLAEIEAKMDDMHSMFPNITTAKYSIGTTHDGRDIWAIKFSDNPGIDESEPVAYYDALHHSREPISMSATINYMFWLLENYATDPQVQYIINNRELYFVPVVNPDGYEYNRLTNPSGGGLWRKNRRDNGNNVFGVDLNRNYAYQFGLNNSCASDDPSSNTYKGPNAFSEPETQAVRDFVNSIQPKVMFSTHSTSGAFGNYLMPYGSDTSPPEFSTYSEFATDFLAENEHPFGVTYQMLGYTSCGTTRDYFHNEGIYAWGPETGGNGFWPPQSNIFGMVDENLYPLFYQAWVAGSYAALNGYDIIGSASAGGSFDLSVSIKNKGLGEPASNVTVSLVTNDPNVTVSIPQNLGSIAARSKIDNSATPFTINVGNGFSGGSFQMDIVTQQSGIEASRETITISVGTRSILFADDAESGTANWTSSGNGSPWGNISDDSYSGTMCFGDSDGGNSLNNTTNYFTLNQAFDLTLTDKPRIEFNSKFSIYTGDIARLQVSTNGGTAWENVTSYVDNEAWHQEIIDISSYKSSNNFRIRFQYVSDASIAADGFYFDDFEVVDYTCPTCPVCDDMLSVYPDIESFESDLGNWSQGGGDDLDWTRDSGGTPSSNTGPTTGDDGSFYMYIEASNPNFPTKTAFLESTCYDLTGATAANLIFSYHMYGNSTDMNLKVEASTDGAVTWDAVPIWTQTGNQGNQWNSVNLDLLSYANESLKIRFVGTTGETWSGDVAIDNIQFAASIVSCNIGDPCDDGDVCTTGETLDANCNCSNGTLLDDDNDGVCNTVDQCPGFDDNLIGTSCDDGDACTTGETYDTNCACSGGIFQDSDNDGVCDANDQCPGLDDALIGASCDDGDACTINDTYSVSSCLCVGVPDADADNDGICDANDQCPGFDDNLIGTSCDDGDACTTGETYDTNCACSGGIFQDGDNDSVCDANDQCPGLDDALIGTSCDDGDACTNNDIYLSSTCGCAGIPEADDDNDGVCNTLDQCPGFDDSLIGTSCDDGDACTTGETYDTNCACSGGTIADNDNDGVCNALDPCPDDALDLCTLPTYCTSSGGSQQYEWIEAVQINTINNTSGNDGGYENYTSIYTNLVNDSTYTVILTPGFAGQGYTEFWKIWIDFNQDGDFDDANEEVLSTSGNSIINGSITIPAGVTTSNGTRLRVSMLYNAAPASCGSLNFGEVEDYTVIVSNGCIVNGPCDDGDACTSNDIYDANCGCTGTPEGDDDNDGVCNALDQCPGFDDSLIGTSCNDGDVCTTGETYDTNCACSGGVFQDGDNDGVCDANDQCPGIDDSLIGTSCDDGDACTSNDIYDANCGCTGTPEGDDDNDGVCNALDQCPGFDDSLIGTSCNDGDVCTTGETYDTNCACSGGVFQDGDNDGVCDANDQCPGIDDSLIGTSCDDGDACTSNDIYDANCGCTGTPEGDDDNDGVCNALDQCPGFDDSLIGTSCNDGDVCTTGETYDTNCACSGGVFQDGDNDGVCDANDQCPGIDDSLIGTSCDDGDACTSNDIYDANCGCTGTPEGDDDNDGVCNALDQCPGFDDSLIGTSCNDGDVCTTGETYDTNCACSGGVFQDGDNDGVCDANDQCPGIDDSLIGTSCDDGDACTSNDIYDANCGCTGTPEGDDDNDGVCNALDQCPGFDDSLIGTSCNDGDVCTTGETYDTNCACSGGVFQDGDNDGVCDANDQCPGIDDSLIGTSCDDGDACTSNDVYDANCGCTGTPEGDDDNDGVCNALDQCPGFDDSLIGTSCNDGDVCTTGETYDTNCACSGGVFQDGDNDGVCDANDQCPGIDDSLIGTSCDDGDACTSNDVYDANCGCTGTPEGDDDNDGVCNALDQCPGFDDSLIGTSCNDGDVCTTGETYDTNCACSGGVFQDGDNDGVCDANDQCPGIDDSLIGTSCDDGDACTSNDVYDANCGCTGTPEGDDDNDGVCNALDQCPGFDDSLIGTSCNDGDVCTTGETYDTNCACSGGVFQDGDNDGVCDANDQCPGIDDSLIGTSCDDGDACTSNDIYDANCGCTGTPEGDDDNDGVCNALDQCPGFDDSLIGTSCNDGDVCTTGETYDTNCACSGGVFQDGDNDGVCDANDQCPGIDDSLIGTSCDDGDACTSNDIYDANCGCTGTPEGDDDNDGVCNALDQCPGFDDSLIGTSCNDGDVCTTGETYDTNCACSGGVFQDGDNDGVCDANDICPGRDDLEDRDGDLFPDGCAPCPFIDFNIEPILSYDPTQDFGTHQIQDNGITIYMVGNVWKAVEINYNFTANTVITFDFKSTLEGEIHEVGFDNDLTLAPDHRMVVYGNQGYNGTFNNNRYNASGAWESFAINVGSVMTGSYQYLVLTADDDANSTGNSFYKNIKIFEDLNGDLNCDQVNCVSGDPCNDGDACTSGETYDTNCNCTGGINLPDSDNDGICDSLDVCPGLDDSLIGTACDDNDPCTIGELYNSECGCSGGIYTDEDGDGFCIGNDTDDNDACVPDPNSPNCSNCSTYNFNDFEAGFGIWNDGGSDCFRYSGNANSGSRSIRIRDNSGVGSSLYSDPFDFEGFNSIKVDFSYLPVSMENNEDFFLEVSINGGSTFSLVQEWNRGTEFENNIRYFESVEISNISFTTNTVIRFRCDASGNGDQIYLDDILIQTCGNSGSARQINVDNDGLKCVEIKHGVNRLREVYLYPNPAFNILNIDIRGLQIEDEEVLVKVFGMDGRLRINKNINVSDLVLDVKDLPVGNTYLMMLTTNKGETFTKKFIKL